jgi:hypothetical protein
VRTYRLAIVEVGALQNARLDFMDVPNGACVHQPILNQSVWSIVGTKVKV